MVPSSTNLGPHLSFADYKFDTFEEVPAYYQHVHVMQEIMEAKWPSTNNKICLFLIDCSSKNEIMVACTLGPAQWLVREYRDGCNNLTLDLAKNG